MRPELDIFFLGGGGGGGACVGEPSGGFAGFVLGSFHWLGDEVRYRSAGAWSPAEEAALRFMGHLGTQLPWLKGGFKLWGFRVEKAFGISFVAHFAWRRLDKMKLVKLESRAVDSPATHAIQVLDGLPLGGQQNVRVRDGQGGSGYMLLIWCFLGCPFTSVIHVMASCKHCMVALASSWL